MKAVGYIRVSTEGQAADGVSLEAQRARIEAWAVANGCTLAAVHVDAGLSGGKANRPGLQAALSQASAEKAALVVYSLSRLARSTRDTLDIAERLDRAGADLVSLSERIDTTTAAGKMIFRMLAVLAEFERDQISERTTAAMSHMKAQGRRVGNIPYGMDLKEDGETLVPNTMEGEAIKIMRKLRRSGKTLRDIARILEARGFKTKAGGTAWTPKVIRSILLREAA